MYVARSVVCVGPKEPWLGGGLRGKGGEYWLHQENERRVRGADAAL